MAEITETNAPLEQTEIDNKAELAQQMQIALSNGIVPQEQILDTPPADTPPIDTPPVDVPPPVSFDSIREKFAYQTPEDAIKEIEEYRKFKENPVAEIEFENEASRKLFEAIKGGKQKEAYAILAEQETLDSYTSTEINKDNAEDIIKLGMKYKFDLSKSEVDHKFKKQFSIPKEPIQSDTEEETDFQERHNEWKNQVADIEMDKIIEAKGYRPELEAKKSKLILPEIEAEVDEDYIQWKKSQEVDPKIEAERVAELKSFTPKTIETKINFNDEANKIAFEAQYEPTVEDFGKTVEMVDDINKFYGLFIGQDGKPDRKGFTKAIHFAVNADKILQTVMNQTKNATIKALLPDNSGGIVRQLVQPQQVNELDAQMKARGISR